MLYVEQLEPRRLMAFSSSDDSFGSDGNVAPLDAAGQVVQSPNVLVQKNGRIVVAGTFEGNWALRRYRRDGRLDHSFGDDGIVKNLSVSDGRISLLAPASDGGFFVVGRGFFKGENRSLRDNRDLVVAKLKSDGRLNKSFRPDGADDHRRGYVRVRANADLDVDDDAELLSIVSSGRRLAFSDTRVNGSDFLGSFADGKGLLPGSGFGPSKSPAPLLGSSSQFPSANGSPALKAADTSFSAGHSRYALDTFNDEDLVAYVAGTTLYVLRISDGSFVTANRSAQTDASKMRTPNAAAQSTVAPRWFDVGADGKTALLRQLMVLRFSAYITPDTTSSSDGGASTGDWPVDSMLDGFVAQLADIALAVDGQLLDAAPDDGGGRESIGEVIVARFNLDGIMEGVSRVTAPRAHGPRPESDARTRDVPAPEAIDVAPAGAAVPGAETFRLTRVENGGGRADAIADTRIYFDAHAIHTFDVAPRDDRRAIAMTLDHGDYQILTPAVGTLAARVAGKPRHRETSAVVRNRAAPVEAVAQPVASDERYDARELGKRIADLTGALAVGRTLGTFAVRVPKPILTTSTLAAAMSRERQRLAPNT